MGVKLLLYNRSVILCLRIVVRSSFRLLAACSPCGCRTVVPITLLTVSSQRLFIFLTTWPTPFSKVGMAHQMLLTLGISDSHFYQMEKTICFYMTCMIMLGLPRYSVLRSLISTLNYF